MQTLDVLRIISCGAVGVGLARAATEKTVEFLKENCNPKKLAVQQSLTFPLADMQARVEAARLMVWKTAWMLDNRKPAGTMSGLTKFHASDTALEVAQKGLQLTGPHGLTSRYPLEKLVRDAKLLQIIRRHQPDQPPGGRTRHPGRLRGRYANRSLREAGSGTSNSWTT